MSVCHKSLQSEAGESLQSLSYVHNMAYIMSRWMMAADLGAEHKSMSVYHVRTSQS